MNESICFHPFDIEEKEIQCYSYFYCQIPDKLF